MIKKLLDVLSEHKDYLETLQGKVLYVADWKDENNGGISFTDYDVKRATVRLLNPNMLSVCCDKFPENALPIKKGAFHINVSVSCFLMKKLMLLVTGCCLQKQSMQKMR